jgi:hypothetical protein
MRRRKSMCSFCSVFLLYLLRFSFFFLFYSSDYTLPNFIPDYLTPSLTRAIYTIRLSLLARGERVLSILLDVSQPTTVLRKTADVLAGLASCGCSVLVFDAL